MDNYLRLSLVACIATFTIGCQVPSLARKSQDFRQKVMDLYVDQAMDNLIRAKRFMPFVQLQYSDFQIQGTDRLGGDASYTHEDASVLKQIFKVGVNGERKEFIGFKSSPVIDQNDIYERYLDFAHTPGLFEVAPCAPPPEAVHIFRECGGLYYFVPIDAAPAFLELVMSTAFMRGADSVPVAYERVITHAQQINVIEHEAEPDNPEIVARITINEPVPAGRGTIVALLEDGRKVRFRVSRPARNRPNRGSPTTVFMGQWSPKETLFTVHNLWNVRIRFYSDMYPPEAPVENRYQQRVLDSLDRIQALQFMGDGL